MKKRLVLAVVLALGSGVPIARAAPGNTSGAEAFALAGVLAPHSPVLSSTDRRDMARLFAGLPVTSPADRKISIAASSIECRTSGTDITSRTCDITYEDRRHGTHKVSRTGRLANEVLATLAAAKVGSGGAAGATNLAVTNLVCTVDPNELRRRVGGGAECTFENAG